MIGGSLVARAAGALAVAAVVAGAFAALWLRLEAMSARVGELSERAAQAEARADEMARALADVEAQRARMSAALDRMGAAVETARRDADERQRELSALRDAWCIAPLPDSVRGLFGVCGERVCLDGADGGEAVAPAAYPAEPIETLR